MQRCRRRVLLAAALALVQPLARSDARWPSKPLRIIVPGGPGGAIDIRARWLADRLAPVLGQPIVVENKPGAGGSIGAQAGAHAAPDGYTLVLVHQGLLAVNPHLYAQLGYDALADFAPITTTGIGQLVLAVNPAVPAANLAELIALAKAKPGRLSFGSPGIGTPPHIASELFLRMASIEATHVPYKGGGNVASDLIGGQITWTMDNIPLLLPHIKAGKLRALAVSGRERVAVLPEVPTLAEAGVPDYDYTGWMGLAAPAATPKEVIAKLNAEVVKLLNGLEAREWFASIGTDPGAQSPEQFAAFIRAEHAKWGRVVREARIKLE